MFELGLGNLAADAHMRPVARPRRASTPVVLWVGLAVTLVALTAMTAIGVRAASSRSEAIADTRQRATPLLIGTEALYVALADADAAASTAFLRGRFEPSELRARYLDDLARAGQLVATVSALLGSDASTGHATGIAARLPSYAALIEAGRTNNRLDNAVGAAYQRRASADMRELMIPAATELYRTALQRFDANSRAATDRSAQVALIIAAAVTIAVLLAIQLWLTRRTHRLVNIGLALATALVVVALALVADRLESQRSAMIRSQQQGSDQLLTLSTMRILALRSMSDENLDVIERGTEPRYLADFDVTAASIAGDGTDGGLMHLAVNRAVDPSTLDAIRIAWSAYVDAHDRVRELVASDGYYAATTLAAVDDMSSDADTLGRALEAQIAIARGNLDRGAADAAEPLHRLRELLTAMVIIAAVAATAGIWWRAREYR